MSGVGDEEERPPPELAVVDEHDRVGEQPREQRQRDARGHQRDAGNRLPEDQAREPERDEAEEGEVGEEGLHQRDEHGASGRDALLREEVHAHREAREPGAGHQVVDRVGDEGDAQPGAEAQAAAGRLRDPLVGARHGGVGGERQQDQDGQHRGMDAGDRAQQLGPAGECAEQNEQAHADGERGGEDDPPAPVRPAVSVRGRQ